MRQTRLPRALDGEGTLDPKGRSNAWLDDDERERVVNLTLRHIAPYDGKDPSAVLLRRLFCSHWSHRQDNKGASSSTVRLRGNSMAQGVQVISTRLAAIEL